MQTMFFLIKIGEPLEAITFPPNGSTLSVKNKKQHKTKPTMSLPVT